MVSVEGFPLTDVEVLGAGQAASEGIVLVQGGKVFYIPSASSNVVDTIDQIIAALDSLTPAITTIATTLTAIGAGMTGPSTAPPPTLPSNVIDITANVTELGLVKTELETLKGALK